MPQGRLWHAAFLQNDEPADAALDVLVLLYALYVLYVLVLQGLKVVRMAAKSRESIGSSVEHLTLHHQVSPPFSGILPRHQG